MRVAKRKRERERAQAKELKNAPKRKSRSSSSTQMHARLASSFAALSVFEDVKVNVTKKEEKNNRKLARSLD